ncbi:2-acylglycerol O-acyltransferase 2-like isoform X2 [Varroa jacobsoni]|uniref:2-acylglycerol O-acyltransferase 2-like isoform X2 n=1 Tax=Varroa jacobsoni TaxID=62625 RepID=UPI000BF7A71A|nr:2-acylglycerol O-acyltransferase 2-like isoform X2 [Varroa jacobsoni]
MYMAALFSKLGIEVAPARIPLERRLQTLAALYYSFLFFLCGLSSIILSVYVICYASGPLWSLMAAYLAWYIWDINTCIRGGRRSYWVRSWRIWRWFRDYFPIRLIKTANLDPTKNYIFGYHPHGIASAGAFCNFATEATNFSELFPGIVPHLLTLEGQFYCPFHRELMLFCGINSVAKESIVNILNYKGKGNAAIIVIGGAQEALDAVPSTFESTVRLKLNSRLGFVRMAIINGAYLVPVFSFGENDIFYQAPNSIGSILRKIQTGFTKLVGFSPPVFHGRGVFQYSYGFLPYRKPITTVIGSPIPVVRKPDPSESEVRELHAKYVTALKELFETHKKEVGAEKLELEVY